MLENPELYSKLSEDHQDEVKKVLDKNRSLLQWKNNEIIMDIGCGTGDVTSKILIPFLPNEFRYLIATDISPSMITYAKNKWKDNNKLLFKLNDIGQLLNFDLWLKTNFTTEQQNVLNNKFTKIFSFFCLQWVKEMKNVAENLWNLLQPGGQIVLLIVVRNGAYIVWDRIVESKKWSRFTGDIQIPFNKFQYMEKPDEEMFNLLKSQGFIVQLCKREHHSNIFLKFAHNASDDEKIDKLRSVDPIIHKIPEREKSNYMKDIWETTKQLVSNHGATDYDSLIIIAMKPE